MNQHVNYLVQTSTFHGIAQIGTNQNPRSRFFWLTIVACAFMGFSTNLYFLIDKYLQIPILTNVYHEANPFSFPDVSFCNLNPVYFPPRGTKHYNQLITTIDEFRKLQMSSNLSHLPTLSDFLYVKEHLHYSHPAWSIIRLCNFQNTRCNYEHFKQHSIWPLGNCFTFNPYKLNMTHNVDPMKQIQSGFRPSLQLVLNKALFQPEGLKLNFLGTEAMPSGVMFMIHDVGTYPHITESYSVDGGVSVDLKITRKNHVKRFGNCNPQQTTFTYGDALNKKLHLYSARSVDCIHVHLQAIIYKACKCVMELYPIPGEIKDALFCKDPNLNVTMISLTRCLRKAYHDLERQKEEVVKRCYKDSCEHVNYHIVLSQSTYPAVRQRNTQLLWLYELGRLEALEKRFYGRSDLSEKALLSNRGNLSVREAALAGRTDLLDVKFVDKNYMMLRIVASSLFMDHIEEEMAYPISRLLSDIGGCLGLFVGASLISCFEIFNFLCDVLILAKQRFCFSKSHVKESTLNLETFQTNTGIDRRSIYGKQEKMTSEILI